MVLKLLTSLRDWQASWLKAAQHAFVAGTFELQTLVTGV